MKYSLIKEKKQNNIFFYTVECRKAGTKVIAAKKGSELMV